MYKPKKLDKKQQVVSLWALDAKRRRKEINIKAIEQLARWGTIITIAVSIAIVVVIVCVLIR